MALKPDRHEFKTDITWFCNDVAERGIVLVQSTAGSGAAMDQTVNLAAVPSGGSEPTGTKPLGLLLNDIVNVDLTKYRLNAYKNEVQIGSKVTLGVQGWWVTNKITGTPVANDIAYVGVSGTLKVTTSGGDSKVGRFRSIKDEKGFAKVEIMLPWLI